MITMAILIPHFSYYYYVINKSEFVGFLLVLLMGETLILWYPTGYKYAKKVYKLYIVK